MAFKRYFLNIFQTGRGFMLVFASAFASRALLQIMQKIQIRNLESDAHESRHLFRMRYNAPNSKFL